MRKYRRGIVVGLLALISFFAVITAVCAVAMCIVDIQDGIVSLISAAILVLGCALASYVSTQYVRSGGLVQSLIISFVVSIVLIVGSLIANGSVSVFLFEKIALIFIFSAIGGIKGINTKKTKL